MASRTTRAARAARAARTKRTKRTKYYKKSKSRSYKGRGGRHSPPSYVGSIQGEFINSNGQQLFRNPTGGIA